MTFRFTKENASEYGKKGGQISKRKSIDQRVQAYLSEEMFVDELKKNKKTGEMEKTGIKISTNQTEEEFLIKLMKKAAIIGATKGDVKAVVALLDRAYGKPAQTIAIKPVNPDSEYLKILDGIDRGEITIPADDDVPDLSTANSDKLFDVTAITKKKKITLSSDKSDKKKPKLKINGKKIRLKPSNKKKIRLKK